MRAVPSSVVPLLSRGVGDVTSGLASGCVRGSGGDDLPLLVVRVTQLPVLVHKVVTGELAAADLAGVILHVQVQQTDLSPAAGARDFLGPGGRVVGDVRGCVVDPRRQQVPFGVLPVAVLRLEGVLAVAAGVAVAGVAGGAVAAVVAGVAGAARDGDTGSGCRRYRRRRPAVLVVLARQVLAVWLATPLL